MDWVGYALLGIITILLIFVVIAMVAGWIAESFFGRSDSWLEYGLDDDEF